MLNSTERGQRHTGLGCMRLSTAPDRDEAAAIEVLHAAFDVGITVIDTADAYCHDHTEVGQNERLIAAALRSWPGDRSRIVVATKGGLTRPQGNWIPDGRARHLAAACEASLRALDVDRIALYQLHVPDPNVPFATSVRALDSLRQSGLVDRVGLCNVTVGQIEEARSITAIDAVQVEISLWQDDNLLSGVAAYCVANGIQLIAARPLGGPRRRGRILRDPVLAELAGHHRATPAEIALAWLSDLSPAIVSIPGATRVETVRSIARAQAIALTGDDRARLDERCPAARPLRNPVSSSLGRADSPRRTDAEIVLLMGLPAAGKSTLARTFVADRYERLNRDVAGGSLRALLPALDRALTSGRERIVMDNTYLTRKSRAAVLQAASMRGVPVRGIWLSTSLEDAQVNAVSRILSRYGRLLDPEEMRAAVKTDVAAFGPAVQFRHQREVEEPTVAEGFSHLEVRTFERCRPVSYDGRAVIVWCDGILWTSRSGVRTPRSADDTEAPPGRGEVLRRYESQGWRVLGLSWQPGIADGTTSVARVEAAIARMPELLGVGIDVLYCPHAAGPPACWCRKPLPGLGVVFIEKYRLDPARCLYVGDGPQDPGFARRLGFEYREATTFFA